MRDYIYNKLRPFRKLKKDINKLGAVLNKYSIVKYYVFGVLKIKLVRVYLIEYKKRIVIRTGVRSDISTLLSTFYHKLHVPSRLLDKRNSALVIIDVGCNIGTTVAHFSWLFPKSKILGVEMDELNYRLALQNCASLKNVWILNRAIGYKSGVFAYNSTANPDGYSLNYMNKKDGLNWKEVNVITFSDLINQFSLDHIDILKIDIEGAEKDIFFNSESSLEWLHFVRYLNVEYHDFSSNDYESLVRILNSNGFSVKKNVDPWQDFSKGSIDAFRIDI